MGAKMTMEEFREERAKHQLKEIAALLEEFHAAQAEADGCDLTWARDAGHAVEVLTQAIRKAEMTLWGLAEATRRVHGWPSEAPPSCP